MSTGHIKYIRNHSMVGHCQLFFFFFFFLMWQNCFKLNVQKMTNWVKNKSSYNCIINTKPDDDVYENKVFFTEKKNM